MRNSRVNGEILAAVEQGARFDRPKRRTNPERTKLDISNVAMDEFAGCRERHKKMLVESIMRIAAASGCGAPGGRRALGIAVHHGREERAPR
jgi:hypothetical protein